ncbi:MAG: sulfurtransferase TusA family protein [Candidatus Bathyarchaeota archaeon]
MPSKVLNLKGFVCPYTQVKALETISKLPPRTVLKILVDNPESADSIEVAVKNAGHKVEQAAQNESIFTITVRKKMLVKGNE